MRKNVTRSAACFLLILSLSFLITIVTFAEPVDDNHSVNAVESADEILTDENEADGESEFISESEVLSQEELTENDALDNPGTGEFFKFMPAVIALVVLVAMVVIKKVRDKNKK